MRRELWSVSSFFQLGALATRHQNTTRTRANASPCNTKSIDRQNELLWIEAGGHAESKKGHKNTRKLEAKEVLEQHSDVCTKIHRRRQAKQTRATS
jgi:hypothetical protein